MLHQGRSHVILRAERIGRAETDIGSASFQRDGQIRGFRRDVQAGCDPHTFQWLLPLESFANESQHGHRGFSPFNL